MYICKLKETVAEQINRPKIIRRTYAEILPT